MIFLGSTGVRMEKDNSAMAAAPNATRRYVLQGLVSLLGILWVLHALAGTNWQEAGRSLAVVSWPLLGGSLLLVLLIWLSRLWRLRHWVEQQPGKKITKTAWLELYLKSLAFGAITPARLGDFSRIALLAPTGLDLKTRMKITLQDKLADLVYIPLGIIITAGLVGERFGVQPAWLVAVGVAMLGGYLAWMLWFGRFLGGRVLLAGIGISLLGLPLFVISNALLFRAAGIGLPVLDVAAIILSVGVLASLPVSIGGLGIREGSLLSLLGWWGIGVDRVPPVLLLEFLFNMVLPLVLYLGWRLAASLIPGGASGDAQ